MQLGILFIILAFIVIIAVVYLSPDLVTAMLIVSLLANFLVISSQCMQMHKHITVSIDGSSDSSDNNSEPKVDLTKDLTKDTPNDASNDASAPEVTPPVDMYGPAYQCYDKVRQTYTVDLPESRVLNSYSEKTNDVDVDNTIMAQKRFRAKRAMDGATVKNADFYKYYYGDELEVSEARPWWGRADY